MDRLSLLAILGLGIYFLTFLALYLEGQFILFFTYLLSIILSIPILVFGRLFAIVYRNLKVLFDNFEGYQVYVMLNQVYKNGYYFGDKKIIVTEPLVTDQDELYYVIYHEIGHSLQKHNIVRKLLRFLSLSYLFDYSGRAFFEGKNIGLKNKFAIAYVVLAYLVILSLLLIALLGIVGFLLALTPLSLLLVANLAPPILYIIVALLMLVRVFIDPLGFLYILVFLSFTFYSIYNSMSEINADLYVIKRLGEKGLEGAIKYFNYAKPTKFTFLKILLIPFFTHPTDDLRIYFMKRYLKRQLTKPESSS